MLPLHDDGSYKHYVINSKNVCLYVECLHFSPFAMTNILTKNTFERGTVYDARSQANTEFKARTWRKGLRAGLLATHTARSPTKALAHHWRYATGSRKDAACWLAGLFSAGFRIQARPTCLGNAAAQDELMSVNNEDNSPQTCPQTPLIKTISESLSRWFYLATSWSLKTNHHM